jgi:hypothetical protein
LITHYATQKEPAGVDSLNGYFQVPDSKALAARENASKQNLVSTISPSEALADPDPARRLGILWVLSRAASAHAQASMHVRSTKEARQQALVMYGLCVAGINLIDLAWPKGAVVMWLRPSAGRLDHLGIRDRALSFLRGEWTDFEFLPQAACFFRSPPTEEPWTDSRFQIAVGDWEYLQSHPDNLIDASGLWKFRDPRMVLLPHETQAFQFDSTLMSQGASLHIESVFPRRKKSPDNRQSVDRHSRKKRRIRPGIDLGYSPSGSPQKRPSWPVSGGCGTYPDQMFNRLYEIPRMLTDTSI